MLVFGLPKDLDVGSVDLRTKLVGTRDPKTSLHFVSTFHYDLTTRVVTVLLAESRLQEFIRKGYEVALANTTVWRIQPGKITCADMEVVGDLDGEIEGKVLKRTKVRKMTAKEREGWMEIVLGGIEGMGFPGFNFPGMPVNGGGSMVLDDDESPDQSQMMLSMLRQMMASVGNDAAMNDLMGGE